MTISAKGITDEITDNNPIDICSVVPGGFSGLIYYNN